MERRSESIAALAKALSAAQGEMQFAKKDSENPFYKTHYANLASVIETIKPHLAKHGLSVVQTLRSSESGWVLESILLHSSGEFISGDYPVNPTKPDPQGFGSSVTYARRYSIMALTGCAAATDDDDGNKASEKAPPAKQPPTKVTRREATPALNNGGVHKAVKESLIPENPWLWKLTGESEHKGKALAALTDELIAQLQSYENQQKLFKKGKLTITDIEAIDISAKNMDALMDARAEIINEYDYNGREESNV